jgi:hypothetical protein
MWVALLGTKDEALGALRKIQAAAETEKNLKLAAIRTDRGGSSLQIPLPATVKIEGSNTTSQHHIHHNRMV